MLYASIEQLVGHTPMLELTHLGAALSLNARIFAKLEYLNPAGSVKDRAALRMIEDAEERGLLTPDSVIIEPTSGNTGIGLAAIGAARGYRVIIVMPDSMSEERRILMRAYGAELVLTDGALGMRGAIERAEKIAAETPHAFIPGQFVNAANADAHYRSTGPEIWDDMTGQVDCFVAGVGTGGTVTGVARYLKEQDPSVRIVGVEPKDSAVLSGGAAGAHGLQGIGAGFVPEILDVSLLDEVLPVTTEAAYSAARLLAQREGILVGISAGAALDAAITLARREENADRHIVVLLPDTGDRYLSTDMFR